MMFYLKVLLCNVEISATPINILDAVWSLTQHKFRSPQNLIFLDVYILVWSKLNLHNYEKLYPRFRGLLTPGAWCGPHQPHPPRYAAGFTFGQFVRVV